MVRNLWQSGRDIYTQWRYGISESTLKSINPGYPNVRGTQTNCTQCAFALDDTLSGKHTQAKPSGFTTMQDIINKYNRWSLNMSNHPTLPPKEAIIQEMQNYGPGARGIITGQWNNGYPGHDWNVINYQGGIIFLDGQNGTFAPFYQMDVYWLTITNIP